MYFLMSCQGSWWCDKSTQSGLLSIREHFFGSHWTLLLCTLLSMPAVTFTMPSSSLMAHKRTIFLPFNPATLSQHASHLFVAL